MKYIFITIVFTLLALMPGYSFAEHRLDHEMHRAQAPDTAKCPVSGEDVKVRGAKWVYNYKGKKYYFCMKSCEDKFKKDPAKYIKKQGK